MCPEGRGFFRGICPALRDQWRPVFTGKMRLPLFCRSSGEDVKRSTKNTLVRLLRQPKARKKKPRTISVTD
jgi:hypothetical protein